MTIINVWLGISAIAVCIAVVYVAEAHEGLRNVLQRGVGNGRRRVAVEHVRGAWLKLLFAFLYVATGVLAALNLYWWTVTLLASAFTWVAELTYAVYSVKTFPMPHDPPRDPGP